MAPYLVWPIVPAPPPVDGAAPHRSSVRGPAGTPAARPALRSDSARRHGGLGGDRRDGGRRGSARRRIEAFDDEPEAERELPYGDREGRERRPHGDRLLEAEQRGEYGSDEQGGADESQRGE